VGVALGLLGAGPAAGGPFDGGWRRVPEVPAREIAALARDPAGERVAAAAGETVYVADSANGTFRATGPAGGPIAALLFVGTGPRAGTLLAGGEGGLRESRDGRSWRAVDLAGEGARGSVLALAEDGKSAGGAIAIGTELGVIVAEPAGESWRASGTLLPGRRADAVAFDARGRVHAACEDGIYILDRAASGSGRRAIARPAQRLAASGVALLAASERGFLRAAEGEAYRDLPGDPGVSLSAEGIAPAGDSGAFVAAGARGVWRVPAGSAPLWLSDPAPGDLTLSLLALPDGRLLAGTDRGLHVLRLARAAAVDEALEIPAAPPVRAEALDEDLLWGADPDIADVRRAALRASHLEPGRIRRNFHGARWRALLPELSLSSHRHVGRDGDQNLDETFTSGATHRLIDSSRASDRDREFVVAAEWDLGGLLFHPEELDVSEEARRVLTLRDDVLDEVNQIYFERRRMLVTLARLLEGRRPGTAALPPAAGSARPPGAGTPPAGASDDPVELRIRIDELTARLDAWTDGYFTRAQTSTNRRLGGAHKEEP
jgi:hypothetical protein